MSSDERREERAFEALIVSAWHAVDTEDVDIEHLPELTDKERAALDSLGPDFIDSIIARGRKENQC